MRYLSLFSGIGGFEIALLNVFPRAQCLGACEIDPIALEIYTTRFPSHPQLGDVRKIDFNKYRGQVDLVFGGSPCQDFSSINGGNPAGISGAKSALFFEFIRCLKECQPRFYVFENVKAMTKPNIDFITNVFKRPPVLVRACDFSPQRRDRLFWANFPIEIDEEYKELFRQVYVKAKGKESLPRCFSSILIPFEEAKMYDHNDCTKAFLKKVIPSRGVPRWLQFKIFHDTRDGLSRTLMAQNNFTTNAVFDWRGATSDPRINLSDLKLSPFEPQNRCLVRRLSSVEGERLQGFPEGFSQVFVVKNNQFMPKYRDGVRLQYLGNAVSVPVATYIFYNLLMHIQKAPSRG